MIGDALPHKPSTDALATAAMLAMYERLVAEKDAEMARRQADIARLVEEVRHLEVDLAQARVLIAYLSEKVADLAASRPRAADEAGTAPLSPLEAMPERRFGT